MLRLIWKEQRISRAEIARHTELARSTVSGVVGTLLRTGLVAEVGPGVSSGGRRPIMIEFQDGAHSILGVDMGANHVAVALTDLRGHVLTWHKRNHGVREDPGGTRALIAELCDACLADAPAGDVSLLGIGVGVPSPVHPGEPGRLSPAVLPAWEGRTGFEVLEKRYRAPLFMDNDANLGALAERWWGAGRGIPDFAYVKVSTGVGSGHVVGGEIYRGATGVAGEIGHMAIDPHGDPCICGLRGCLATLVGGVALVARARKRLADHPDSLLAGTEISLDSIEDAALAGDALALELVREAAGHLGVALAGMLNLLNPSMVILGGGLSRLGEVLLEPIRETVRRHSLVSSLAASEIRTSELGPRTVAVGAATLVLEAALADPRIFPSQAHPEPR
jgi:glucokinase-like ROK family protein